MDIFLGFSNHINIRLYFDPKNPSRIKRSTHCIVDDIATISLLMKAIMIPRSPDDPPSDIPSDISANLVQSDDLPLTSKAFPDEDIISFDLTLPPFPAQIATVITDDPLFNIPFLKQCTYGSYIYIMHSLQAAVAITSTQQ